MSDSLAALLADRFRDDAQALRARATVLAARSPKERGGGPDAAACHAMADACDRVRALFDAAAGDVAGDAALGTTASELERLLAAERSPDARYVYEGAVARLRQALDPDADDDDDPDDEDDED